MSDEKFWLACQFLLSGGMGLMVYCLLKDLEREIRHLRDTVAEHQVLLNWCLRNLGLGPMEERSVDDREEGDDDPEIFG